MIENALFKFYISGQVQNVIVLNLVLMSFCVVLFSQFDGLMYLPVGLDSYPAIDKRYLLAGCGLCVI